VTSTYPPSQPGPRPGPPPGGFRPGPPPGGFRPGPPPGGFRPGPPPSGAGSASPAVPGSAGDRPGSAEERPVTAEAPKPGESTGHPAVDAALRSLENAAGLAPGEQIAAYEDAHRVLQETLASIDG
jgi:hypothetical protein